MKTSRYFRMFMWLLFIFGGAALGYYLDKRLFGRLYVGTWCHLICLAGGVALMQIIRRIARNTGRYLHDHGRRGQVPRLETNRLVTDGYYALMRHPMHQGLMLAPWAFGLLAGSPSFVLIVAPLEWLIIYVLILTFEEKEARRKFGQAYEHYARLTPRFCWSRNCWKKLIRGWDA